MMAFETTNYSYKIYKHIVSAHSLAKTVTPTYYACSRDTLTPADGIENSTIMAAENA